MVCHGFSRFNGRRVLQECLDEQAAEREETAGRAVRSLRRYRLKRAFLSPAEGQPSAGAEGTPPPGKGSKGLGLWTPQPDWGSATQKGKRPRLPTTGGKPSVAGSDSDLPPLWDVAENDWHEDDWERAGDWEAQAASRRRTE